MIECCSNSNSNSSSSSSSSQVLRDEHRKAR
jgi:hypothetical protein